MLIWEALEGERKRLYNNQIEMESTTGFNGCIFQSNLKCSIRVLDGDSIDIQRRNFLVGEKLKKRLGVNVLRFID